MKYGGFMMNIQSSWLNLPVKDLKASATFFENIGFTIKKNEAVLDKMRGIETADHKIIMLIEQGQFEKVAQQSDIGRHEALVSVSVKEAAEVDDLLNLVETAGGKVLHVVQNMKAFMVVYLAILMDTYLILSQCNLNYNVNIYIQY